jgi:hypothetical protein
MSAIVRAAAGLAVAKDAAKLLSSGSDAIAPTKKKKKQTAPSAKGARVVTKQSTTSRRTVAPMTNGLIMHNSGPAVQGMVLPFSTSDVILTANSTGVQETAVKFSVGPYYTTTGLDFNPTAGTGHPSAYGASVARIADSFSTFRLNRLRLEYVPIVPTNVPGLIIFGALAEPTTVTPTSFDVVGSCGFNLSTPLWQGAAMDLTPLLCGKNSRIPWYATRLLSSGAAAEQNSSPGTVMAYMIGIPPDHTGAVGILRITGTIEFRGLARMDAILAPTPLYQQPRYVTTTPEAQSVETPSSSSSSSSHQAPPYYPPALVRQNGVTSDGYEYIQSPPRPLVPAGEQSRSSNGLGAR